MMTLTKLLKCASGSLARVRFAGVVLLFSILGMSAQSPVSGTITASDTGMPLPMANVAVKGSTNAIASDIDGKYEISAKSGDILVFSFVGFVSQEVKLAGQTKIDIKLSPDENTLNEVVVIGYGTQKKSDLTGAISVVDVDDAKKTVTHDVAKMLQGQVAGVTVQSSGEPGGFVNIKIRGASSLTNNNPTFVIDGVIVDDPYDFAPGDIESMQVLKDASAAAIYGVRGAGGVIIITTKKGKNGKLNINLKSVVGFQNVAKKLSLTDREQYQQIANEAWVADPINLNVPLPGNDPTSEFYIDDVNTDWQDAAFRTGQLQNQAINLAGGTETFNFSLNLDRFENTSYVRSPQEYVRTSTNLNLGGKLGKFRFGAKLSYSDSNKDSFSEYLPGTSNILNLLQAIPTMPVYDENRLGGYGGADNFTQRAITLNVIGWNNLVKNEGYRDRFLGNVWGEFEILNGLKYKLSLSADQLHYGNRFFVPPSDLGWYYITTNDEASLDVDNGKNQRTIIDNLLTYDRTFGKHHIELLGGYVQERNDRYRHWSRGVGFQPGEIAHLEYADNNSAGEYEAVETRVSYLGRAIYTFDDRYIIQGTWRQDRSSLFPEQNNAGDFYSVSGAWKIHNDFKLPSWWTAAKLRGGYGLTGNNAIGPYFFSQTVNAFSSYDFNDQTAPGTTNVARLDQNISWETTKTANVALETAFFNNKLTFSAEYFVKTSEDILAPVPLPFSTGSFPAQIVTNAATFKNYGWEFALGYQNQDREFKYGISANLGTIKNKVLKIGDDNLPLFGINSKTEVGRSLGELFVYQTEGIFQNQAEIDAHAFQANAVPGDVKFKDVNGDDIINDEDRTYQGTTIPKISYGINANASYKGVDLSIFLQGVGGNKIYNSMYNALMTSGLNNYSTDLVDHWTVDNTDTNVPRVDYRDLNGNSRPSNRFVESGNYLRIQSVELGYTLPLKDLFIKRARVYVSGQNLYTFTNYRGLDPDINYNGNVLSRGVDGGSFPNPRGVLFGVDISF
ncbi:MAG: TonB-dependent receptor [Flavobacterium sp.]|uniref:SusC/RagA family TonB-linked outer membrane protein n=1 Tax=Flavobacterium sp. TaxID=239 RepID=UPI001211ADC7|nr:TonB-dependent receptor [Flavobacterium sp.]RZJ68675.1 MAG: TonB-dependent receptor [Flavobacterium sp.]